MRKSYYLSLWVIILSFSLNAIAKSDGETDLKNEVLLFPIEQNSRWGYINSAGKIEINPRFVMAYTNRGIAYEEKKLRDKAIADYSCQRRSPHHGAFLVAVVLINIPELIVIVRPVLFGLHKFIELAFNILVNQFSGFGKLFPAQCL